MYGGSKINFTCFTVDAKCSRQYEVSWNPGGLRVIFLQALEIQLPKNEGSSTCRKYFNA